MMFSQFLLLNGLFQGEVIVCNVGVQHLMFDAKLCIWIKAKQTLFYLVVIYFGEVGVLYIFELVHEDEILIHFLFVVNVIFFMVHHVLVGRLGEVVDVYLAE